MPTGYTADVQSGKITEFDDFAWRCARAMGALVLMRDEPSGAPIPERFEPSTAYHDGEIASATARLAELQAMSLPALREAAQQAHAEATRAADESRALRAQHRARYDAMLAKVSAWQPPTSDHVGFKDFMTSQLQESADFDCGETSFDAPPVKREPDAWKAEQVQKAEWSLNYHTKARADEISRTEGRNRWLADLRASLAQVTP